MAEDDVSGERSAATEALRLKGRTEQQQRPGGTKVARFDNKGPQAQMLQSDKEKHMY